MVRSVLPGLSLALVLGLAPPAVAGERAFLVEATGGKSMLALSLLGDFPLIEDKTYLTFCYGISRAGPGLPATHQLCAGLDHAVSTNWMISGILSGSPRSSIRTDLGAEEGRFTFVSNNASLGASLAAAYNTAGFSEQELAADASLGITAYNAPHTWTLRNPDGAPFVHHVAANVLVARPGLGVMVTLGYDLELSLRGSYYLYSADPLTVGRISDEEISRIAGAVVDYFRTERTDLAQRLAESFANTLGGRILQADAISGLAIAPLHWELRPTVAYRFSSMLRGQLGYAYERYVPTQGLSHVISTKWTVRMNDAVRVWGAFAWQIDLPEDARRSASGLLTFGGELTL